MVNETRSPHPLGPWVTTSPPEEKRAVRGWALVWIVACGSLLGMALYLKPSTEGLGTHTQLGLPQCSWPTMWGIPCPTCGMTTAFAHTVRGRWLTAFEDQPMGFLLAVATMVWVMISLRALVTGRTWRLNGYRLTPLRVTLVIVGSVLLSWGYKILVTRGDFG